MIAYADTGFLVSLYGGDAKSGEARALVAHKPSFILTPLVEAEFLNAMELQIFRKLWTRQEARAVRDSFLRHQTTGAFRTAELTAEVWERALTLSRRHSARVGSRTLDILHVASVLTLKPEAFYTFDLRQRRLAKAEKLEVLPSSSTF